jgi:DNA-binding transcriptional MerR regulator
MMIGDVARASGVSVRAVRHYENFGLIRSVRAENGYREFPADTVLQVRRIARMIALGFSTAEIATLLWIVRMVHRDDQRQGKQRANAEPQQSGGQQVQRKGHRPRFCLIPAGAP